MNVSGQYEIDSILSPIAQELSYRADDILDLREAAARRNDPGRCLSCYFRILAGVRPESMALATPLREWLEQHLEVVAQGPELEELERIPIHLDPADTEDIEDFCQQMIHQFRYDRTYQGLRSIELSFQFKEAANIA